MRGVVYKSGGGGLHWQGFSLPFLGSPWFPGGECVILN